MDSEYRVVLNPEAAMLTTYLSKLPEADLLYVIFVCDYNDSPFWQLPTDIRERKAFAKAYANGEKQLPRDIIENAIEEYRSLIWDEREEDIRMLKDKINKVRKSLMVEDSDTKIKSLLNSKKMLNEELVALERDKQATVDSFTIKGKRKLSHLELWQRNIRIKKQYDGE